MFIENFWIMDKPNNDAALVRDWRNCSDNQRELIGVLVNFLEIQRSSGCRESVPESGGMVMMLRLSISVIEHLLWHFCGQVFVEAS